MTTPTTTASPSLSVTTTFSPLPSTLAAFRHSFEHVRAHVEKLRVKDVRALFALMRRHEGCTVDHFVPQYGITIGEFAVAYVINQPHRGSSSTGSAGE